MQIDTSSTQKTSKIIASRQVINGASEGMLQLLPYKYAWADEFFDKMYSNSWHPAEINLNEDASQWESLSPDEQELFSRALSFISNLDTVQTYSLTHALARQLTAPELQILIIRQAFEETIHVLSYNRMIEMLHLDPEDTYGRYRHDQELKAKLDYITTSINLIIDPKFKTGTSANNKTYAKALVNNILLEGLFFYCSFTVFYALARIGKMQNSSRMIGLINRDEAMHCALITKIFKTLIDENPALWTAEFKQEIRDEMHKSTMLEASWGKSIIGNGAIGLTPDKMEQYAKFLTDMRLANLDMEPLYKVSNPYPWIDEYTQVNQELGAFFESNVQRYSQEVPDFEESNLEW